MFSALTLAIVFGFVIWERAPQGHSVSASNLLFGTVRDGNFVVRIRAPGELRPRVERWVTSQVAGTVMAVHVHSGTTVGPDSLLLTLVNPQLIAAVMEAKARLARRRAHVATETAQLKGQLLTLQGRLSTATVAAQALMMRAAADRRLYKEHVIGRLQYETDQLNAGNAKAQEQFIRQRLAAWADDLSAQREAEAATIAASRSSLQEAQLSANFLALRAGVAGVIQVLDAHPGQAVKAGAAIARIANTHTLEAVLDVGPESARELTRGQKVAILVDGDRRSVVPGRLARISPTVVRGVVPVIVHLSTQLPPGVRPHLAVSGIITVVMMPHTLYVERPVGVQPQTRAIVFVVNRGGARAVRTSVQFGIASTNFIQVVSGLRPGQRIVVSETRHWHRHMRID